VHRVIHRKWGSKRSADASRAFPFCHKGEQHCGERRHRSVGWSVNEAWKRIESVVAGPLAEQTRSRNAQRSGRTARLDEEY
jgi:predicted lipoprotein